MESMKTVGQLVRTRHRCESGNPSMRSNLGFADTSSLESIFAQFGVSPSNSGTRGPEYGARSKTNNSSEPRILKVARKSFDTLDVGKARPHDRHLKINPELLAQQMTLIELKLFQAIQPEEFLSLKWNSKEKLKYAPNIVASTRWFNQIIFWVQKDILNEETLSRRTDVLSHFVRIAKKLIEVNNYSSAMAVVSGLLVQSVYRLSATWAALPSRDRSAFRKLATLFSQDQNFINLRTAIDTARLPCIPYLGLYLSDLTYIDVAASTANQQDNGGSWDSQGKRNRLNNVLRIIANFQQSNYPFVRDEKIASYLEAQRYIEELQRFIEDNNYKLSLRLEPPTPEAAPSQTTDSAFSFAVKTNWFMSSVLKPVPASVSTSETDPATVATLDRRPALVPTGTSLSLGEMNSAHSSPINSSARRHFSPIDQVLPPPPPPPPHQYSRQNSTASRERSSPLVDDYLFGCSSGRPLPGRHATISHRRMGSWNEIGFSSDAANTYDDHSNVVSSLLKGLSSQLRHCDPNTANSSWSTSSGSTGRSVLPMDQTVPVQQPLGPLLDQTDVLSAPSAQSTGIPVAQYNHDSTHSSSSSSSDQTGSSSIKSAYPRTLGIMLPNLMTLQAAKSIARPLVVGVDSEQSLIACTVPTGYTGPDECQTQSNRAQSPHHRQLNADSPTSSTELSSVTNRVRVRQAVSQSRSDTRTIVDQRKRNSPTSQRQQQLAKKHTFHKSQPLTSSCSQGSADRGAFARLIGPIQSKDKHSPDCALNTRDPQNSSTLETPPPHFDQQRHPSGSLTPVHTCPSLAKHGGSSLSGASIGACSHSSFTDDPTSSHSSKSLQTDGESIAPSYLALAALAAVQGTIADELARLSAMERRSSVANPMFRPSSLISPAKAVCLDVQFANGLRVLREGAVLFSRSSNTAFRQAQFSQLAASHGELNNTSTTLFGSCDALDALRQRPDYSPRWHASLTESTTQRTNLEVPSRCADRLSLSMLTPSPSHSSSRASLASFVLDLPSLSSVSSSSSSSWISSTPSAAGSPQPPQATPRTTQASHNTPPKRSGPCSHLGYQVTNQKKHSLLGWFHRLRCRSHRSIKPRWGVLIQSDTRTSNQAFLVLFKLHHAANYGRTRGSVGQLAAPPAAVAHQNSKFLQKQDYMLRKSLTRAQISYAPEMFSASHCQVVCIGSAVVDDCPLTRNPSVLLSDLIGQKRRVYRLSPVPPTSVTSDVQLPQKPRDLLVTMFQHGCDADNGTGDRRHAGSPAVITGKVCQARALRLPLTNPRKTEAALRSLRRLWPATWMAARRRDVYSSKNRAFATDHSPPTTTPTSQSSLNAPDLDQTGPESQLAWLPLLSLFPDQHPKHETH